MTITTRFCLTLAASLMAGETPGIAQDLNTQILLPDPVLTSTSFEGYAYGKALLMDPLPPSDAGPEYQSLFLGTLADPTLSPTTIYRVDPDTTVSPAFARFTVTKLDARFRFVTKLAYNQVEQRLYSSGDVSVQYTKPKRTSTAWLVRESDYAQPGAANQWRDSEPPFVLAAGAESRAQGIAMDDAGNVYVCGRARDAKGYAHFLVRRKPPGLKATWSTVYNNVRSTQIPETAICYFPGSLPDQKPAPPAILMVGNENNKWTIVRSLTGDKDTWFPVDTVWSAANSPAGAKDITYDPATGNMYVVGYRGTFGSESNGWIVRVSADGGQTWETLLNAPCPSYSGPSAVTTDPAGNVLVIGHISVPSSDGSSNPQVQLLRCPNPVFSSQTSFAGVPLPFGETNCDASFGNAITTDASGAVFAASAIYDWVDSGGSSATTYAGWNVGLLRLTPAAP
jgi:hypothetical protein